MCDEVSGLRITGGFCSPPDTALAEEDLQTHCQCLHFPQPWHVSLEAGQSRRVACCAPALEWIFRGGDGHLDLLSKVGSTFLAASSRWCCRMAESVSMLASKSQALEMTWAKVRDVKPS